MAPAGEPNHAQPQTYCAGEGAYFPASAFVAAKSGALVHRVEEVLAHYALTGNRYVSSLDVEHEPQGWPPPDQIQADIPARRLGRVGEEDD